MLPVQQLIVMGVLTVVLLGAFATEEKFAGEGLALWGITEEKVSILVITYVDFHAWF